MNIWKFRSIIAWVPTLLLVGLQACKKGDSKRPDFGQGLGSCQINSTLDSINSFGSFVVQKIKYYYDDLHRPVYFEIDTRGLRKRYRYEGNNLVWMTRGEVEDGFEPDSIVLDNNGRIIFKKQIGANGRTISYHYRSNDELFLEVYSEPFLGIQDSISYSYENGDLVKIIRGGDTTLYTYNLSENFQIGDARAYGDLYDHGRVLIKTKHLVKSMDELGQYKSEYFYEFDKEHKIVRCSTKNDFGSQNYSYFIRNFYYTCE